MSTFVRGVVSALCLMLSGALAFAGGPERPNRGKELYSPPWGDELVELATSCKGLRKDECATLRRLTTVPHAYWLGLNTSVSQDLRDLHTIIRDALSEKRVPTIVLYSLPDRDCGGGVRLHKKVTPNEYQKWVPKIADAVTYYKRPSINVIIEPGGLSRLLTEKEVWCHGRTKRAILEERIELIRYVLWNMVVTDGKGNRVNPYLRLFVDVGGPGTISEPAAMLALAKVLEQILKVAEADGISVNVGGYASIDESRAWAKELLALVRGKSKKRLTVAIDISRSGGNAGEGCNMPGAALDEKAPTLDHHDPIVELTLVIKDPSRSDGESEGCHGGSPTGTFDLPVFREYLRNTSLLHNGVEP